MNRIIIRLSFAAIIVIALATSAFPQDAKLFINQGNQFAEKKMFDKAIECYQRAIKVQPANSEAHNNLGFVYEEAGFFKEALQEYETALKLKPDYKEAQQNILSCVTTWSQDLIDHGQCSTAEEILKAAIARSPQTGEFYYFLGIAYQAQDKFPQALEQWKKAASINPGSSTAHYVKAIEKRLANDVPSAVAELKEAIRTKPDNAYAHNMLGMLYTQTGKIEEAKAEFQAALTYKPNYVEPYQNLGYIFSKEGKVEDALKFYKTAAIKNPYSVKALETMGIIYRDSGRYFDAESNFKRALRVQPLNARLYNLLALTYARQSKLQEAVNAFETAASIQPNNQDAHFYLAVLFKNNKNEEARKRAVEEFQKCLAIDANSKAGQQAAKLLAEMGASASATPQATPASSHQVAVIQCESPDGDLVLSISPSWEPVQVQGEGSDKILWIMRYGEKGGLLTVYKPRGVPVNNLDTVKGYIIEEAKKEVKKDGLAKGAEAPFKLGEVDACKVKFQNDAGASKYLYFCVKNKKAYVFAADVKDDASLAELEKVLSAVKIN